MKLFFLDLEPAEAAYFEQALAGTPPRFVRQPWEVEADAEIVSVFIDTPIDAEFIAAHPALRLVATRSTGVDHIDLEACRARGVAVARVPAYGEHAAAEHTFALILALSRHLRETIGATEAEERPAVAAGRAFELHGKTLGVVGAGRIGRRVIGLAQAFGMRVLACDVQAPPVIAHDAGVEYAPFAELIAQADIITLHLPLGPDTYHLLDRDALARCRRGVLIVNTARGALIDTDALLDALDSGQVGGAGLDVLEEENLVRQETTALIGAQIISRLRSVQTADDLHEHEPGRLKELRDLLRNKTLLARPNVIFTPHVAFRSVEAIAQRNAATVENIAGFARGEAKNLV